MFSYAAKRIVRGRSIFLAFFLSVTLAVTLFSGMLQGSDTVGMAMLGKALNYSDVDIVAGAESRNLTRAALNEVMENIGGVEHVGWVDRLVRSKPEAVTLMKGNTSVPFIFVAISNESSIAQGITGIDDLERGKLYIDIGSTNATLFQQGDDVTLKLSTYNPYGSIMDIQNRYFNDTISGLVQLDDRSFSIIMGEDATQGDLYALLLRDLLIGTGSSIRRVPHNLIIMGEATFWDMLDSIYGEKRMPSWVLIPEVIVGLDRGKLVTPWDIPGAKKAVGLVNEGINSVGASYGYAPANYLGAMLDFIESKSNEIKTSVLIVALPVFFTAWYLGQTVSDITLGQRRREIGILLARGLTQRQIFDIFILESLLVSLLAGAAGILIGAAILPLIAPGLSAQQTLGSISPMTMMASLAFSGALTLLVVYRPARSATRVSIVDALREYESGEEGGAAGSWQEPLLALLLGGYKVAIMLLGVNVDSLRPTTDNVVISMLYSTWWGVDYILTYVGPLLFFWGLTKLVIQYTPLFEGLVGRVSGAIVGDKALFSTLSARRNIRRTVASTFMMALILGYGVARIGSMASTEDFTVRTLKLNIGDASVWLFSNKGAGDLAARIASMDGVLGATVETWFSPQEVPIRAIDPLRWSEIAYVEDGWLEGAGAFERMNASDTAVLLERNAAKQLGKEINDTQLVKIGSKVYSLTIVGIYGKEIGDTGYLQDPTLYVPEAFLKNIKDSDITRTRILVKLKNGVDMDAFISAVKAMDRNVEAVDVAEEQVNLAYTNVFLMGPKRIEELGVYFAALMASIGVVLIVSVSLRSRWKELTIMAIRGFSTGQLGAILLVESIGMVAFAGILGAVVGFISLRGEIALLNSFSTPLARRALFPLSAQIGLVAIVGLLLASTVIPILIGVRRASDKPVWSIEE
jgi:ABC-type lipoprotein release transport system permease subunit